MQGCLGQKVPLLQEPLGLQADGVKLSRANCEALKYSRLPAGPLPPRALSLAGVLVLEARVAGHGAGWAGDSNLFSRPAFRSLLHDSALLYRSETLHEEISLGKKCLYC